MSPEEKKQQKLLIQAWGQQDLSKKALEMLLSSYPRPNPWDLQASWEQQHKMAGQQMVLRDLMKIMNEGSL